MHFFEYSVDKLAVANYNIEWLASANYHLFGGDNMMPLNLADIGEPQIIKRIGGSPDVKKHLEDMGFNIGSEISIVSVLAGNLIVKVKESRVAVSDELARKIMV